VQGNLAYLHTFTCKSMDLYSVREISGETKEPFTSIETELKNSPVHKILSLLFSSYRIMILIEHFSIKNASVSFSSLVSTIKLLYVKQKNRTLISFIPFIVQIFGKHFISTCYITYCYYFCFKQFFSHLKKTVQMKKISI
jgi:hypothetical protein